MDTTTDASLARPRVIAGAGADSANGPERAKGGEGLGGASSAGESTAAPQPVGVTVRALRHGFGELHVLDELSLDAAGGEVLGIVGPSGSGKTTLLELIAGLREPEAETRPGDRGEEPTRAHPEIAIGSATDSSERLARCAYMPQRDLLLPWLRAIDNASIAARNRGASRSAARAAAAPLFERFGLGGFEDAHPGRLSGGMRQRVAFLRTLLADKPVLLLDEPFGALDAITRAEMQEWLAAALAAEPRTVLLVTHDVEEALYLCDRVLVLTPRPAQVAAELAAPEPRSKPRVDVITSRAFVSVREAALAALVEGTR